MLLPGFLGDSRCAWPLRDGAGSPSGYLRALSCVECYGMKGYNRGRAASGTAKVYWGDNGGNWECHLALGRCPPANFEALKLPSARRLRQGE